MKLRFITGWVEPTISLTSSNHGGFHPPYLTLVDSGYHKEKVHFLYDSGMTVLSRDAPKSVIIRISLPEGGHGYRTGDGKTMLEINDEACRRIGFNREELLRMTPMDIVPPKFARKTDRFKEIDYYSPLPVIFLFLLARNIYQSLLRLEKGSFAKI